MSESEHTTYDAETTAALLSELVPILDSMRAEIRSGLEDIARELRIVTANQELTNVAVHSLRERENDLASRILRLERPRESLRVAGNNGGG